MGDVSFETLNQNIFVSHSRFGFVFLALCPAFTDHFLHVVIAILVHVFHHLHKVALRILALLTLVLPSVLVSLLDHSFLGFQIRPGSSRFFCKGYGNTRRLNVDLTRRWDNPFLKSGNPKPIVLAVQTDDLEIKGSILEVTCDGSSG